MNLDPRIILAGSNPDLMAAIDSGNTARARQDEFQHQNAFRSMMQAQGPGIMQGNQNALAELSRFDPMQALQVQSQRQTMEINANTLQQARAQAAQAARTAQDQQQAQAEAQQAQRLLGQAAVALQRGDQAAFGMIAREFGLEGMDMSPQSMALMEAMAVGLNEGVAGGVAATVAPAQPDMGDRFRVVGNTLFDLAAEGGPAPVGTGQQQTETIFGPDGRPIVQRGGSGTVPTERQSVIGLFSTMMEQTMPVINGLESRFDPTNLPDNLAARAGWGGNYIRSEEAQQYEAAARAWGEAVLRIQTGAAATADEIDRVFKTYFAQPGDNAATIRFKRQLRESYGRAVMEASGGTRPAPTGGEVPLIEGQPGVGGGSQLPGAPPGVNMFSPMNSMPSLPAGPPAAPSAGTSAANQPPPGFAAAAQTTADRLGVSIEEIWQNLPDEAKAAYQQ